MRNAKDFSLSQSFGGIPDVGEVVEGWLRPMVFGVIRKTQVDGYTQEIIEPIRSRGMRQPFTAEQLQIKAEGERSWNWNRIYTRVDVILKTDDRVIIDGRKYRVMTKTDWIEYGYLEYEAIEDYVEAQT